MIRSDGVGGKFQMNLNSFVVPRLRQHRDAMSTADQLVGMPQMCM